MAELGAAFVSGAIGIKLHDREDHAADDRETGRESSFQTHHEGAFG
jgi:hypothetical protein